MNNFMHHVDTPNGQGVYHKLNDAVYQVVMTIGRFSSSRGYMFIGFFPKAGLFMVVLLLLTTGCDIRQKGANDHHYLLRIDDMVITGVDYLEALEVMKASYPYTALQDENVVRNLKTRLLKQLTEELILSKRAAELGLSVSPQEVEKAVEAIKNDYPQGTFEKMLMEKAIPLKAWEKRVAMRLLTEKVIDRELVATVSLKPEEVTEFYRQAHAGEKAQQVTMKAIDADFVKQLRREKAQKRYPQWIDTLQQQYDIELNESLWKKIYK